MARAGLGKKWTCLFANDVDPKKAASYLANWGDEHFRMGDVCELATTDLSGLADLAWASFPCQDLSLAGAGAGLNGKRSGTFWAFWRLMENLAKERRGPSLVVFENVCGALSSHGGADFASIGSAIVEGNYRFGAVVIDAVRFLPQSRPRLFILCIRQDLKIPKELIADVPDIAWRPPQLMRAYEKLSSKAKNAWVWWRLPAPPAHKSTLYDLIEEEPQGVVWHTPAETQYLLSLMSPINKKKVETAMAMARPMVAGVYRRTRKDKHGLQVQRAEVRFDNISGCLRTPAGGSSRQSIMVVNGNHVRSRLLSPREAARLMGLPESYKLPDKYNDAYHLIGDGVVVPVVRFLASNLLEPLLAAYQAHEKEAA